MGGVSFDPSTFASREQQPRPSHRHGRRDDVARFRVTVTLNGSEPTIWRRLDARSDVTLDLLHWAIQDAFGWLDYHLHRFSLGGPPFADDSELFLCPFEVDEGEDGTLEHDVRLDETLAAPGDVLHYVYDFGDHWDLTIRLDEVHPLPAGAPLFSAVGGERAAPPEDCGSRRTADELADVLDDPAHFDLSGVEEALGRYYYALAARRYDDRLLEILRPLTYELPATLTIADRLAALGDDVSAPGDDELAESMRPQLWFLEQAADGGIPLTAAGWMKPAFMKEASQVVPGMKRWIGTGTREEMTPPVANFREALVKEFRLLRKYKDRLLPTRAGQGIGGDARLLLEHLSGEVRRRSDAAASGFLHDSGLLVLAHAAAARPGGTINTEAIAAELNVLGYRHADGGSVEAFDVTGHPDGMYRRLCHLSNTDGLVLRATPVVRAVADRALTAR